MKFEIDPKIRLGCGNYGIVLSGTLNSKAVAVKKHYEYCPSLKKEARLLKCCRHENVVRYLGFHESGNECYLIMELALGGSLSSKLGSETFSTAHKQSLVVQLCRGLEHIHEHRILHRDIHAGNIVFKGTDLQRLLIADFGIAQSYDDLSHEKNCHDVVTDDVYTYKSDVYLLGLVVYHIITDQRERNRSYIGDDILARSRKARGLSRVHFVKGTWELTVLSSLSRNPTDRPTVRAFREAFEL